MTTSHKHLQKIRTFGQSDLANLIGVKPNGLSLYHINSAAFYYLSCMKILPSGFNSPVFFSSNFVLDVFLSDYFFVLLMRGYKFPDYLFCESIVHYRGKYILILLRFAI